MKSKMPIGVRWNREAYRREPDKLYEMEEYARRFPNKMDPSKRAKLDQYREWYGTAWLCVLAYAQEGHVISEQEAPGVTTPGTWPFHVTADVIYRLKQRGFLVYDRELSRKRKHECLVWPKSEAKAEPMPVNLEEIVIPPLNQFNLDIGEDE